MSMKYISGGEPEATTGEHDGIRYEIYSSNSTTATLKVYIPEGNSVIAKTGCMLAASPNIDIKGEAFKSWKNRTVMTATEGDGWVIVSPAFFGSIAAVELNGNKIRVADDACLLRTGDITTSTTTMDVQGSFFAGNGFFVREFSGTGIVFVAAVGSLVTFDVPEGESIVVDNGHLVSWPAELVPTYKKASKSWWGTGISGEGIVAKITGPAQVNVQTKSREDLIKWLMQ